MIVRAQKLPLTLMEQERDLVTTTCADIPENLHSAIMWALSEINKIETFHDPNETSVRLRTQR